VLAALSWLRQRDWREKIAAAESGET
jgi:hypothetical protein